MAIAASASGGDELDLALVAREHRARPPRPRPRPPPRTGSPPWRRPCPPATPARGPATTDASISSRLTAPTWMAMAKPATRPAIRAVVGSMPRCDRAPRRESRRCRPKTEIIAVMDDVDSEILRLLREDGRFSWRDLGAAVGLSANAAAERVRRLRQAGVITGFVALVDPAAGGRHLEALVGITLSPGVDSDHFSIAAARLGPVIEVLHLTGAPDYQLRVACRTRRSSTPCCGRCACATAPPTPTPRSSCAPGPRERPSRRRSGSGCRRRSGAA